MMYFKKWFAKRKLNKKIQHTLSICDHIYQSIPSYHLAKQAREEQQLFSYEYIYGEIHFLTFAHLLMKCTINPNSIFYDLGSGSGKAVICSALLCDFKRAIGIEQLHLLHQCAEQASKAFPHKNIYFYQADLLQYNWLDADILFINAATYIGDFWQKILLQLQQLKTGTQIIIISKQLPAPTFNLIHEDYQPMSWGMARVGIYTCAES
jgi:precorrin-6B methylase 2